MPAFDHPPQCDPARRPAAPGPRPRRGCVVVPVRPAVRGRQCRGARAARARLPRRSAGHAAVYGAARGPVSMPGRDARGRHGRRPGGDGELLAQVPSGSRAPVRACARPQGDRPGPIRSLRIPNPSLPDAVREAGSRQMINHRGPEFGAVGRVTAGMDAASRPPTTSSTLTSAGTGALEAAVVNCFSPGDTVLVVSIGVFGDRLAKISDAYGAGGERDRARLGHRPPIPRWSHRAGPAAASGRLKAVLMTHNETSTGVTNPLGAGRRGARCTPRRADPRRRRQFASAASPFQMDAWDLDVVLTGSQKGWMVPPGLAMVGVSPRAWEANERATLPRFYWDFKAARESLEKGQTPYTPAVSIYFGLDVSLKMMRRRGARGDLRPPRRCAAPMRTRLSALGLGRTLRRSRARLQHRHRDQGAGGDRGQGDHQGDARARGRGAGWWPGRLEGHVFRVGHLGSVSVEDICVTHETARGRRRGSQRRPAVTRGEAMPRLPPTRPPPCCQRMHATAGATGLLARIARSGPHPRKRPGAAPRRDRILVAEPLAEEGLAVLRAAQTWTSALGLDARELLRILPEYDALLVRSQVQGDAEAMAAGTSAASSAAPASAWTTSICGAATQAGIVVVNAPTGNTIAATEHTLALLMALARHIPAATPRCARQWERAQFMGARAARQDARHHRPRQDRHGRRRSRPRLGDGRARPRPVRDRGRGRTPRCAPPAHEGPAGPGRRDHRARAADAYHPGIASAPPRSPMKSGAFGWSMWRAVASSTTGGWPMR